MNAYPRDLIGYGRTPPQADWPGNAHIAVQFVLNYEEGGEHCVLHGDAASETFLSKIVGAAPYPDRHLSMDMIDFPATPPRPCSGRFARSCSFPARCCRRSAHS